jgi:DNA-binding NarL/FixJ family response regulator
MSPVAIRVLCVDDNQMVAEALQRRIQLESRFEWVGWMPGAEGLLEEVRKTRPHVMLIDIDMPGRDTFEVVHELAQVVPDARAMMFSGYVRGDYIDRAIEAGAWGYVSKNASIDEVLAAIEQVARGEFAMTAEAMIEQNAKHP